MFYKFGDYFLIPIGCLRPMSRGTSHFSFEL